MRHSPYLRIRRCPSVRMRHAVLRGINLYADPFPVCMFLRVGYMCRSDCGTIARSVVDDVAGVSHPTPSEGGFLTVKPFVEQKAVGFVGGAEVEVAAMGEAAAKGIEQ